MAGLKSSHYDIIASPTMPTGQQSWIWMGINAVMAVFFALAAFVQIDDPDPYIWIPVYVIPSLLCCCVVWSRSAVDHVYWRITAAIYLCFAVIGIVYLTRQLGDQMKGTFANPLGFEEGRELFGLVITLGWILMCWFSGYALMAFPTGKPLSALTVLVVLLGFLPLALWGTCYQFKSDFKHCNEML